MASRVATVVRKHVPLIKFRKSVVNSHAEVSSAAATAPAQIPEPPIITVVKHAVAPPLAAPAPPLIVTGREMFIEDWQLAKRYRRKALSVEEIDCINRGGGAM